MWTAFFCQSVSSFAAFGGHKGNVIATVCWPHCEIEFFGEDGYARGSMSTKALLGT